MQTLQRRAKFYARIIGILFASQGMTGATLKTASRGARHLSLGIKLHNPVELDKALKLSEAVALSSNSEAVLAQRQAGLIIYQFQLAQAFWQSYTRDDLPSNQAIGLAERKQAINFTFDPPHALIAGSTGSGKTETVKSILLSLMTTHTPDELSLVVCDPHIDLSDFDNVAYLAMPIATTQEEIKRALLFVNRELAHRKVNNIKDDKILVLVIDEAIDTLTDEASLEIAKSVSQAGRKYRVYVIVGTQKPSHRDLPNILDNLLNRFVGQVSDGRVSANLTGHAGLQAHKLTGSGDFIHVGIDTMRFQVAMATQADFDGLERKEVKPVEIDQADVIELPAELPQRPAGRPRLQLNPEWLAWYFYHNPGKISRAMAKELLGLSRDNHYLHRDFCKQFVAAYLKLRSSRKMIGA